MPRGRPLNLTRRTRFCSRLIEPRLRDLVWGHGLSAALALLGDFLKRSPDMLVQTVPRETSAPLRPRDQMFGIVGHEKFPGKRTYVLNAG